MPKATVRANARSLSKSKSRRVGTTDLTTARAAWQTACAAYDAASERYLALCGEMDAAARAAAGERSKGLVAVYQEEDKLAVVMDAEDTAASAVLAAPASIETLPGKLAVFSRLWARERGVERPLNGGDVADVAAAIALDLLTLMRRGEGSELVRAA
jgi:hypothetical protein